MLFFSLSMFAQSNDSTIVASPKNTRTKTLGDIYQNESDSLNTEIKSILFQSFEGASIEAVKNAYSLSRKRVDSVLVADSLNPNFWRVYSYQIPSAFVQANKSPQMAMAIFLPWFLIISLIIIIIMAINTLIVKPYMYDAEKPSNASNITQSQEESEDEDEDEEYDEEESKNADDDEDNKND